MAANSFVVLVPFERASGERQSDVTCMLCHSAFTEGGFLATDFGDASEQAFKFRVITTATAEALKTILGELRFENVTIVPELAQLLQ